MTRSRSTALIRVLGFFSVLFPFCLGALGMYAFEEVRYSNAQAPVLTQSTDQPGDQPADAAEATARQTFDQVMAYLENDSYYRPIDKATLWYGAAAGLAKAAGDNYTAFITPAANSFYQEDLAGHVEGIGVFIGSSTGEISVLDTLPGSPAEKAGLKRHDKIKQINGYETTGLSVNDASAQLRGPAGSTVRLTIQRNYDTPFDIDLVRQKVEVPACTNSMRPDQIAYIRCWLFDDRTVPDLDAGLQQATKANARALILDLRSNAGGYTVAAQQMIGRFVPPSKGVAFYMAHHKGDFNPDSEPILAPPAGGPTWYDKPVVILMNGDTASASEIVAAALQEYQRAKLIGTHTNGKGSEQEYFTMDDGSGLFITTVHWLTPGKQDLNRIPYIAPDPAQTPTPLPTFTPPPLPGTPTLPPELLALHSHYGVIPDFAILSTPDDDLHDRDPEMARAVAYILTGK